MNLGLTEILETIYYVEMKFKGMTRQNGDPMVTHSTGIAAILASKGYVASYIIVGLLHDVLEDTDATEEEIRRELPFVTDEIMAGVWSLTKTNDISLEESINKAKADKYGSVIKGVDRLQNAITIYKDRNTQEFIYKFIYDSMAYYYPALVEINNPFLDNLVRELQKLYTHLDERHLKMMKEEMLPQWKIDILEGKTSKTVKSFGN